MKVTGPTTSGAPDATPDATVGDAGAATDAEAPAAELDGAAPVDAGEAPGAAERMTADIAAQLVDGKIGVQAALEQVVERVIDGQLGPDAPAAVRDQVRAALHEALASDPLLAERLRQIQSA
jgi:hypothetical protein